MKNIDPQKIQIAYENLDRLIRPGGSVICSKLVYRTPEDMEVEKRIFEKSFEFIQCRKYSLEYFLTTSSPFG